MGNEKYLNECREFKKGYRRYKKWLRKKRREFKRYSREWNPYESLYILELLQLMLKNMKEYYEKADNIWLTPINDNRLETITKASKMLDDVVAYSWECDVVAYSWECDNTIELINALKYIGEHIYEW